MPLTKKKIVGNIGEEAATKFLRENGYTIKARNVQLSHNELDIVAFHRKTKMIVFVEVKTRSVDEDLYSPYGAPSSAVTLRKQIRTIQAARDFLNENFKYKKYQPRFDVVEIYLNKTDKSLLHINHIENAFGA